MSTIIDASDAVLGRLSTCVAKKLLNGEEIIVVNAEKAIITGKKSTITNRYKQKREIGTSRKGPFFPRMADRIVKRTIRGMIPYQKPHGRAALKRLRCYISVPKEFKDKKFETVKDAQKQPINYITVEELSKWLGAKM